MYRVIGTVKKKNIVLIYNQSHVYKTWTRFDIYLISKASLIKIKQLYIHIEDESSLHLKRPLPTYERSPVGWTVVNDYGSHQLSVEDDNVDVVFTSFPVVHNHHAVAEA